MTDTTKHRRGDELYIRHGTSGFLAVRLTRDSNIAGKANPMPGDQLDREDLKPAELIDMIKDGRSLFAFIGPNGRFVTDEHTRGSHRNEWRMLFTGAQVHRALQPFQYPLIERGKLRDRAEADRAEAALVAHQRLERAFNSKVIAFLVAFGASLLVLVAWSHGVFDL